jgi:hypothetical protein
MDFATTCARMFLGKPAKVRQTLFMSSLKMMVTNCTVTIILCRVKTRVSGFIGLAYRGKDIVFFFHYRV